MQAATSKRKQEADTKKSVKAKREPFGIVWTDGAQRFAICHCDSHEDGDRKVKALRAEHDDFLAAGGDLRGDEHELYFFYTTMDGRAWVWDEEAREAKRAVYQCTSFGHPFHTHDDELAGKEVDLADKLHKHPESSFLGNSDSSSMAWTAHECSGKEIEAKFWRNLYKRPLATFGVLRTIYSKGDYENLPSIEEIERMERGEDDDEEEEDE